MRRTLALFILCGSIVATLSCGNQPPAKPPANGDTPTEAYKRLYAAVKAKDMTAIKADLTKKTVEFAQAAAKQYGKPEDSLLENGMTATTFSESLPTIRDERVKDDAGAIEVWNSKDSRWEDLPFIVEDGQWKLAFGEFARGQWRSPGVGRDVRERMAANALSPQANK